MIEASCQPTGMHFRIFDNSGRGHCGVRPPASEHYSSSGLGLNICRDLLHSAGGKLNISTSDDEGWSAKFNLPLQSLSKNDGLEVAQSQLLACNRILVNTTEWTRESVSGHLKRWAVPHDSRVPDSSRDGRYSGILVEYSGKGPKLKAQIQKIQEQMPGVPVAIVMPCASPVEDRVQAASVTSIYKPMTRAALAAWLIACSLDPHNA